MPCMAGEAQLQIKVKAAQKERDKRSTNQC